MILFVDDEKRFMESYVLELVGSGYDVVFETNVDDALRYFEDNQNRIDLLILDIMMPPGTIFSAIETEMGLRTGVRFYQKIREQSSMLPIILLTNISDERVAEKFSLENRCWYLRKMDFLPFELAEKVKSILNS